MNCAHRLPRSLVFQSCCTRISKRISSNNPQKLAYDACFELYSNDKGNFNPSVNKNQKDCINDIISSLSINRLQVIAKYMTARHIIPFLGSREINLTEDQERQSKRLLEYCNLSWEEQCLNFHDSKRVVRTFSNDQVRKKMYSGSSEAWREYSNHFVLLLDKLSDEIDMHEADLKRALKK